MATFIEPGWASEAECKTTIKTCFDQNNYLLDPHTAVGLNVALKRPPSARKLLLSSTAHYSKFGKDVLLALGTKPISDSPCELFKQLEGLKIEPVVNESLKNAMRKQEIQNDVCSNDLNAVKENIEIFLKELKSS
jgi:threonine synthase